MISLIKFTKLKILLLIILITILISSNAFGFSCVSYKDCPKAECVGAIRTCENNICKNSACLVPKSSDITTRESVQSFNEAVKPFEKGINLSKKTKNPSLTKNSMLSSLGVEKILFLLLKTMGILFITLIVVLFFVFARSKGIIKIIVIVFIPILALIGIIIIIGGTEGFSKFFGGKESWNTLSYDDFISSPNKKYVLEDKQLMYLSQRLLNVGEFTIKSNYAEMNVLVFEINDKRFIREIKLPNLNGENIIKEQEYIIKQKIGNTYRYIFDEDRFIFIITSTEKKFQTILKEIISVYPTTPTKSKLFSNDNIPPIINIIEPLQTQITSNNLLSFVLTDNESGIDMSTLRITNFNGINKDMDCIENGQSYECNFLGNDLDQGTIHYNIFIQDFEGNSKKVSNNFVYDNGFIELTEFNPTLNSYTNNLKVTFKLFDQVSGIKSILIDENEITQNNCIITQNTYDCNYIFNFNQGKNTIIIETIDNANNLKLITHSLYFDDLPPVINSNEYSIEISDTSPISKIRINNHLTYCSSKEKINSIYVEDKAGNFASI